jgi:hypothetical protein
MQTLRLPETYIRSLMDSLPDPMRCLRLRFPWIGGFPGDQGLFLFAGDPIPAVGAWTPSGSHRFPGDPFRTFAPLQHPGRIDGSWPWSAPPMLPPPFTQRRLQLVIYLGANTRLQYPLPTLHERCRHHPCKARFRLAGSPLPGGSQTLWIAMKGFSYIRSPFRGLSCR